MIELRFGPDALERVRFAISPLSDRFPAGDARVGAAGRTG
jgi:hypothetical protein